MKNRHQFSIPSGWPVLPIGKINLNTGKNRYFDDIRQENSTLVLLRDRDDNYRVIMGANGDYTESGKIVFTNLYHDQTFRSLGTRFKIIGQYKTTDLESIIKVIGKTSINGYVFK